MQRFIVSVSAILSFPLDLISDFSNHPYMCSLNWNSCWLIWVTPVKTAEAFVAWLFRWTRSWRLQVQRMNRHFRRVSARIVQRPVNCGRFQRHEWTVVLTYCVGQLGQLNTRMLSVFSRVLLMDTCVTCCHFPPHPGGAFWNSAIHPSVCPMMQP